MNAQVAPLKSERKTCGILKIPITQLVVVTTALPFFAFFICIYLSLSNNFTLATATHCGVPNYLPSISSAIGEFVPQRYIWRFAIALHTAPRFMVAGLYANFMKNIMSPFGYPFIERIRIFTTILNLIENCALLGLSFVSSKENYGVHKTFFIIFMVCSEIYMMLTCLLLKGTARLLSKPNERMAFRRKKQLMLINIACFFVALYFYYRHNAYCEPGMYTVFALMEYLIVLSNMAFHMTAYYDFYDHDLVICERVAPS